MTQLIYVLEILAIGVAWPLMQRRREHRPVVVLLAVGLLSDVGVRAIRELYLAEVIRRLGVDAPWPWPERAMGHLTDAFTLAWPATLAGAAIAAFLRRHPWPAIAGYVAFIAGFVIVHPIAGDGSLRRALMGAQVVAVAVSLGCALTWYQRSRKRATSAQACMLVFAFGELGALFGSWRHDIFADWHLARLAYVVMFVVVIAIQGSYLWLRPSTSPP
jgi:hypothetical protein